MTKRPIFLGANWKMHGTQKELSNLFSEFLQLSKAYPKLQIVVFPPFVYLPELIAQKKAFNLDSSSIYIGAQNQAEHLKGAYTGEVSPLMLVDIGCDYVLLGHSERRNLYDETDQIIARKFALAIEAGLKPVLCVGETEIQRDIGETESIITEQLDAVINDVGIDGFQNAVIAYEPVWAIGTGKTPTVTEIQDVHAAIRQHIAQKNTELANNIQIIYGGSLKPDNAQAILALPDVDGGLIGGASLKAADFKQICNMGSGTIDIF